MPSTSLSMTGQGHRFHSVAAKYVICVSALLVAVTALIGIWQGGSVNATTAFRPAETYGILAFGALSCLAVVVFVAGRMGQARARAAAQGRDMPNPVVGLLTPFLADDSEEEAALRYEQARNIFDQLNVMMAINVANALLVTAVIWDQVNPVTLGAWAALVLLVAASGFIARIKTGHVKAKTAVSKRTLRRISMHAGVRGLLWGSCFALFFGDVGPTGQLVLLSVSLGMLAGGVPALALVPSAALLFGLGVTVPTLLRLVSLDGGIYIVLSMFALTFSASMVTIGCQLYRTFASNVLAERVHAEQSATISLLLNEVETTTSDWLWEVDAQSRLVRFPERMRDVFGFAADRSVIPLLTEAMATAQGHVLQHILGQMLSGGSFRDVTVETLDARGRRRWVALTASPKAGGGYRGVGSEITARMDAQEQAAAALARVRQAEQRLKDAIDALGAGFVLTDSADRTLIANKRYAQMFPASALVGPNARFGDIAQCQAELWQPHRPFPAQTWLTELLDKRRVSKEPFDIQLPSNQWIRVEGCATTEGGIVTVLTDISDIKEQEAELARQSHRLAQSNQELQQFAAVASHDLQEPLRKIEAFGSRLKNRAGPTLDKDSAEYLERMTSATTRMRRLITDLLAFSRAAKSGAPMQRVDLDVLLAEVLDDVSITTEERGAKISVQALGTMDANATQFRQLMQNLISNSLKFSKPDVAPVITLERRVISDTTFELRLNDNGIGFDMKYHDQIFEIFQRLHGREHYEGTGIGLATCRKIVERHGGSIRAESKPGLGTVFILTFPIPETSARHAAA
jgi:signal transduction histidine kinase